MIITIDKNFENNKEYILQLIKQSNPNKEQKIGFWLIDELIKKQPSAYLNFDSEWEMVYFVMLDNENKPCAMSAIATNYSFAKPFNGYSKLLCLQSLEKGCGDIILKYSMREIKNKFLNKGLLVNCYTESLIPYYKKFGFKSVPNSDDDKLLYLTFKMTVNSALSENYAMDPTMGSYSFNYGVNQSSGYTYKVLPMKAYFQGNKNTEVWNDSYIHKGSHVKGVDKHGNKVTGRIYRIVRNGKSEVTNILILSEKTGRFIEIELEGLMLLENSSNLESYSINMARLSDRVKRNGPLVLESKRNKDVKFLATLHKGEVKVFTIINENGKEVIESIDSIFDVNESLINSFLNIKKLND